VGRGCGAGRRGGARAAPPHKIYNPLTGSQPET